MTKLSVSAAQPMIRKHNKWLKIRDLCCNERCVALQSFGVGTAAVGMTVSFYALARLMTNLPAGILADRHGRHLLLVWGPAVTALGNKVTQPAVQLCVCIGRLCSVHQQ